MPQQPYQFTPSGREYTRTVQGQKYTASQAYFKVSTEGDLDAIVVADGVKTVLDLLKDVATALTQATVPVDPSHDWDELLKVPANGVDVTVTFGASAQHQIPKP